MRQIGRPRITRIQALAEGWFIPNESGLAIRFGISPGAVWFIRTGKTWAVVS